MKKKILIVSDSLVTGGLEKCLVNFCNALDKDKYDIDLYLFNDGRDLQKDLKENINILAASPYYSLVYNTSFFKSFIKLLLKFKFSLAFYRLYRFIKIRRNKTDFTEKDWKYMKKTMLNIKKHYDIAVGFAEGTAGYFVADCIDAAVKSCWIHTDLKSVKTNPELDRNCFRKVDYVCTVSNNSKRSLIELYPEFKDKYRVFFLSALYDYEKLNKMAKEPNEMDKTVKFKILSVGRLVELKGFHLCVKSCKMLLDNGYDFKWYIVGDGDYRKNIEQEIEKYGVSDYFILLKSKENPYTYMNSSDICVQPSSYEGMSLVIYEEKYFNNAVVLTDVGGNKEMITDRVNGLFTKRNSEDIFNKVKYLLDNEDLLNSMKEKKSNLYKSSEEIVKEIENTFIK